MILNYQADYSIWKFSPMSKSIPSYLQASILVISMMQDGKSIQAIW